MQPGFNNQHSNGQPPPIGFFSSDQQSPIIPPYGQQRFNNPQQGFNNPQQGFNNPQQGFNNPQQGFNNPQQGFNNPQQGFNNPQQGFQNNTFYPNQPGIRMNQPGFQPSNFTPTCPTQTPIYEPRQPGFYQNNNQPGPQINQPYYSNNNNQQYNNNRNWNVNEYLRQIFMQIDMDRNNFITPNELQQALSKAQSNFNFDIRTIDFILKRFDTNHDNRISLDEFNNLYAYLNDEYATFILNDTNGNGTIESHEMTNTLSMRLNSRLNEQTIQQLVNRVEQMLQTRITFDIFCRVNARFDILSRQYQHQRPPMPIEQYFMQQFFNEFW